MYNCYHCQYFDEEEEKCVKSGLPHAYYNFACKDFKLNGRRASDEEMF